MALIPLIHLHNPWFIEPRCDEKKGFVFNDGFQEEKKDSCLYFFSKATLQVWSLEVIHTTYEYYTVNAVYINVFILFFPLVVKLECDNVKVQTRSLEEKHNKRLSSPSRPKVKVYGTHHQTLRKVGHIHPSHAFQGNPLESICDTDFYENEQCFWKDPTFRISKNSKSFHRHSTSFYTGNFYTFQLNSGIFFLHRKFAWIWDHFLWNEQAKHTKAVPQPWPFSHQAPRGSPCGSWRKASDLVLGCFRTATWHRFGCDTATRKW